MDDETSRYDTVTIDGGKVLEHRKHLRLTQQRVAEAIGRSRGWISVIEGNKQASVSRRTAQKLSETLQIDLDDLLAHHAAHNTPSLDSSAAGDPRLGDFTFGTPTPVSGTRMDEDAELETVLVELKRLERRVERLLEARRRKR